MLDSRPSISADGQIARLNLQPPITAAQLARWAPFVFARTYREHASIVLTENRKEVAQSLVPAAMLRPWRWNLGDGTTTTGWTIHHAYSRPGTWRITVDAYFPGTKKWYTFDQASVTIVDASASKQHN
jgi:hypothetical protein